MSWPNADPLWGPKGKFFFFFSRGPLAFFLFGLASRRSADCELTGQRIAGSCGQQRPDIYTAVINGFLRCNIIKFTKSP